MNKKAAERARNIAMVESYAEQNPEMKEMIEAFKQVSENGKLRIKVGNITEDGQMMVVLTSNLLNPTIIFTSYKDTPQILIKDGHESIVLFSLDSISNLKFEEVTTPKYKRFNISLHYRGYDYWVEAIII